MFIIAQSLIIVHIIIQMNVRVNNIFWFSINGRFLKQGMGGRGYIEISEVVVLRIRQKILLMRNASVLHWSIPKRDNQMEQNFCSNKIDFCILAHYGELI